ncbi:hypothetical protein [Thermoproteus tenax]|uniref:Predicted component of Type II/IV secretion system n=1 Tax=Thermoproteus tenax (strain ATCC 35583 / DSM 2078 / JCM 9277 / NBRC 100435 / Kra 1) TaxID=768679 RepID=G4RPX7_THETK|nr:hypothetical protein [Thermoproteus tenax]CCC81622.1 Predicted component of Type II/IV secretion system [Thermoproteus tenax Kra 1]
MRRNPLIVATLFTAALIAAVLAATFVRAFQSTATSSSSTRCVWNVIYTTSNTPVVSIAVPVHVSLTFLGIPKSGSYLVADTNPITVGASPMPTDGKYLINITWTFYTYTYNYTVYRNNCTLQTNAVLAITSAGVSSNGSYSTGWQPVPGTTASLSYTIVGYGSPSISQLQSEGAFPYGINQTVGAPPTDQIVVATAEKNTELSGFRPGSRNAGKMGVSVTVPDVQLVVGDGAQGLAENPFGTQYSAPGGTPYWSYSGADGRLVAQYNLRNQFPSSISLDVWYIPPEWSYTKLESSTAPDYSAEAFTQSPGGSCDMDVYGLATYGLIVYSCYAMIGIGKNASATVEIPVNYTFLDTLLNNATLFNDYVINTFFSTVVGKIAQSVAKYFANSGINNPPYRVIGGPFSAGNLHGFSYNQFGEISGFLFDYSYYYISSSFNYWGLPFTNIWAFIPYGALVRGDIITVQYPVGGIVDMMSGADKAGSLVSIGACGFEVPTGYASGLNYSAWNGTSLELGGNKTGEELVLYPMAQFAPQYGPNWFGDLALYSWLYPQADSPKESASGQFVSVLNTTWTAQFIIGKTGEAPIITSQSVGKVASWNQADAIPHTEYADILYHYAPTCVPPQANNGGGGGSGIVVGPPPTPPPPPGGTPTKDGIILWELVPLVACKSLFCEPANAWWNGHYTGVYALPNIAYGIAVEWTGSSPTNVTIYVDSPLARFINGSWIHGSPLTMKVFGRAVEAFNLTLGTFELDPGVWYLVLPGRAVPLGNGPDPPQTSGWSAVPPAWFISPRWSSNGTRDVHFLWFKVGGALYGDTYTVVVPDVLYRVDNNFTKIATPESEVRLLLYLPTGGWATYPPNYVGYTPNDTRLGLLPFRSYTGGYEYWTGFEYDDTTAFAGSLAAAGRLFNLTLGGQPVLNATVEQIDVRAAVEVGPSGVSVESSDPADTIGYYIYLRRNGTWVMRAFCPGSQIQLPPNLTIWPWDPALVVPAVYHVGRIRENGTILYPVGLGSVVFNWWSLPPYAGGQSSVDQFIKAGVCEPVK